MAVRPKASVPIMPEMLSQYVNWNTKVEKGMARIRMSKPMIPFPFDLVPYTEVSEVFIEEVFIFILQVIFW